MEGNNKCQSTGREWGGGASTARGAGTALQGPCHHPEPGAVRLTLQLPSPTPQNHPTSPVPTGTCPLEYLRDTWQAIQKGIREKADICSKAVAQRDPHTLNRSPPEPEPWSPQLHGCSEEEVTWVSRAALLSAGPGGRAETRTLPGGSPLPHSAPECSHPGGAEGPLWPQEGALHGCRQSGPSEGFSSCSEARSNSLCSGASPPTPAPQRTSSQIQPVRKTCRGNRGSKHLLRSERDLEALRSQKTGNMALRPGQQKRHLTTRVPRRLWAQPLWLFCPSSQNSRFGPFLGLTAGRRSRAVFMCAFSLGPG